MRAATAPNPAGNTNTGHDVQTVESLMRIGREVFDMFKIPVSQSKLSRMIRAYRRDVLDQFDASYGPVQTLDTYLRRTWTDLTGERAVHNVMAGGDCAK